MRVITLKRIIRDTPDGTFGLWVFDDGYPYFTSVELPYKNNAHDISSIPPGEYICNRIMSPKRGFEVYELAGVPNRTAIEIHPANSIRDLLGCMGVGTSFGIVETKDAGDLHGIRDSRVAFTRFMAMLKNDPQFKLVVQEV